MGQPKLVTEVLDIAELRLCFRLLNALGALGRRKKSFRLRRRGDGPFAVEHFFLGFGQAILPLTVDFPTAIEKLLEGRIVKSGLV